MPIYIQDDDLQLAGTTSGGSDDDIVVVDDERVGLIGAIIGRPSVPPLNPPVTYRVVSSSYVPSGDEILMTRGVANDSGYVRQSTPIQTNTPRPPG